MEYDNLTDFLTDEQMQWLTEHTCEKCGSQYEGKCRWLYLRDPDDPEYEILTRLCDACFKTEIDERKREDGEL
jgi:hypothetical protein